MSNDKISTISQALFCACDDIDFVAENTGDSNKHLLSTICDSLLDARVLLDEVKDDYITKSLVIDGLKRENQMMFDFICESRLMKEYIKHKEKYE